MKWNEQPAFEYRGFHIDCARHMFDIEEIKKMVDVAAEFRFNYFHWHLSDDQGFRIESDRFPMLHEIGGYRDGDYFGGNQSDEREGGYYTKSQIRDMVAYCKDRGIEVIPEIDMPGHVSAILAAYPEYSCNKERIKVVKKGGIFTHLFCLANDEMYDFVKALLDEVMELFPCKYFHIGGDEVVTAQWEHCDACKNKMNQLGIDNYLSYQNYFENIVASYVKSKGKTPIVWNDTLKGGNLDSDIIVQCWLDDENGLATDHIAKGGKIIMSNYSETYCDYPYGKTSLKRIFEQHIIPQSMQNITESEAMIDTDKPVLDTNKSKVDINKSVLGNECLLWTEFIRTNKELEEMMWPRFAASGYAGWQGDDRGSYEEFAKCMKEEFDIFEKYGVCATEEDGWILSEDVADKQIEYFGLLQQGVFDKCDE